MMSSLRKTRECRELRQDGMMMIQLAVRECRIRALVLVVQSCTNTRAATSLNRSTQLVMKRCHSRLHPRTPMPKMEMTSHRTIRTFQAWRTRFRIQWTSSTVKVTLLTLNLAKVSRRNLRTIQVQSLMTCLV